MRRLIFTLLLILLLSGTAYGVELPEEYWQAAGLQELQDAVPPEAGAVLSDYDFSAGGDADTIFSRLGDTLSRTVRSHFAGAARSSASSTAAG